MTSILWEQGSSIRADGRMDRLTKLVDTFHIFANAPKNALPGFSMSVRETTLEPLAIYLLSLKLECFILTL
jgi:hypothetical protein